MNSMTIHRVSEIRLSEPRRLATGAGVEFWSRELVFKSEYGNIRLSCIADSLDDLIINYRVNVDAD